MRKLFLFIASVLITISTMATNISGPMYASNLVENDDIVLVGNTVLFMNTGLALKSISGNYTLEIQGTEKLTVTNPDGHAITVTSLNLISTTMEIRTPYNGLSVDQDITMSNGSLLLITGQEGIFSQNGNITLDGIINVSSIYGHGICARNGNVSLTGNNIKANTTATDAAAVQAGHMETNSWAEGGISITGGTIVVSSNYCAVNSVGRAINISGNATLRGSQTAIRAAGLDFSLIGGTCTVGNVNLTGTFELEGGEDAIFSYGGDINLISGSISAKGSIYSCVAGDIILNGDIDVTAGENRPAICARCGNITINGNLEAVSENSNTAAVQAGHAETNSWAEGSITITGGTIVARSNYRAVFAVGGTINISGNATLHGMETAISATGMDFTLIGGECYAGDVILNGTFDIFSRDYAIFVYDGNITLQSGSITSTGAIYAQQDITINGDLNATYKRTDKPCIVAGTSDPYYWKIGYWKIGNISITGNTVKVDAVTSAIEAYGGNINLSGNMTITSRKDAISATGMDFTLIGGECYAGDVTLNGTFDIQGKEFAIYLYDGKLTHQNGGITSVGAIYARQDITINGNINATCTDATQPCIKAGSDDFDNWKVAIGTWKPAGVTITGEEINIHAVNNAILAIGGNIKLAGKANITSENATALCAAWIDLTIVTGELFAGDVIFDKGEYSLKGKEFTVESKRNIAFKYTKWLSIVSPSNGGIREVTIDDVTETTIVNADLTPATYVFIAAPPVSGSVALTSEPAPGDYVGFTLSGDVAMSIINNVWQISDDGTEWNDIEEEEPAGAPARDGVRKAPKLATDGVYQPTEAQIGKYLRVKVEAEGCSGYLYSPVRRIAKFICTKVPEAPTLNISNNKVVVSNAKETQEYIIFNVQRDPAGLVESDWAYAVSPDADGSLELDGVLNSLNCVYTRVKETKTTLAGKDVEWAPVYNGSQTALTAIKLTMENRTREFDIQGNELNCTLGDVIRITAAPVPSDATGWVGIKGDQWLVNGAYSGSPYGTFYADAACNTPLTASAYYSTVYFKTAQQKSCVELRAEIDNAQGTIYRAQAINIGDANGEVLLDHVTVNPLTIGSGESLSGIRFYQYPKSATLENLTAETTGTYRVPVLSFNTNTGKMSIDATNADQGEYTFTLKRNGEVIPEPFTVTVTKGRYDVDSIQMREKYITADPGDVVEIIPLLYPANSEADILWYTTDEVNGPVVNGKVTIAADAPIGTEIYITALAMGRYDNCKITVSGEKYGLYVASTQVTSRNRGDILGDGKFSFDGMRTLTMNGDVTLNTPVRLVQNTGVEDLLIDVAGNSTVTQEVGVSSVIFDLQKNTTIRGGLLSITANDVAISVKGNSTLTLDSANLYVYAQYPLSGNIVGNDSLSIINSRVEISAKGSAAIDDFNGGISLTACIIQTPAGGEIVDATIEDGNGSQVRNLLIVPYKEKHLPLLGYFPGTVKTEKEEAAELPMLWNPDQLPIIFSSSEPTVATVDATGVVTIVGVGTTTITATFVGDEEYLPIETSYILTVTASSDTTAIEDVRIESEKAQKILHEGALYIIRPDGQVYNATGVRVK